MIIAVASLSALSGTSPHAVRVATERAHTHDADSGQVLLVTTSDASPAHDAIDRRGTDHSEREIPTAVLPSAKALQMLVPRMAQDYDDIVIDVSGVNTPAVRTALVIADLVVLPFEPAGAAGSAEGMTSTEGDVREFVMTVDIARHYNPQLRAVVVAHGHEVPDWLVELVEGQSRWQLTSAARGGRFAPDPVRSTRGLAAADPLVASVA